MSGTKAGGIKTRETNKAKYGSDYYVQLGKKGGKNGRTGGFASQAVGKDGLTGRQRAALVGKLGGLKSRKPKTISSARTISSSGATQWTMDIGFTAQKRPVQGQSIISKILNRIRGRK